MIATTHILDGPSFALSPNPRPMERERLCIRHHPTRPGIARIVRRVGTAETEVCGWRHMDDVVREYARG